MKNLNGAKTYIVAALGIASAAYGYFSGSTSAAEAIQLAWTCVLGVTIRHGISTKW